MNNTVKKPDSKDSDWTQDNSSFGRHQRRQQENVGKRRPTDGYRRPAPRAGYRND